ncbi:MAG: cell division ATP-binding protein FtsE [Microbacterium sp.]|jgi:cell division transport system ATP-binding protein|nr:cell division ATP-binding protein FtsE [Microbacterium sp.]
MIRFENVTKRYRGTPRPALSDVDFEIQRGEFVFLVGASGSGKSSCLRLILREDIPTAGRVLVLGSDTRKMSNRRVPYFRRHIGSVFQDFRLLSTKTVAQNVAFALQVTGASRALIQQSVPEALELVGLQDKAKRMPTELSGGEQQRVAIARAIVNRPQVLLADEPTGNLDPGTSTDIMQLLARINANGTTVVMATHEAGFVDQMQRRVIELRDGVIIRDDRHGGYGDTSAIPRLEAFTERGVASAAALTAVLEVQREVAAAVDAGDPAVVVAAAVAVPVSEPADVVVAAATDAPFGTGEREPDSADGPETPAITRPAAAEPVADAEARPMTRPIALPDVQVAELGVADRLGLSEYDDNDEVGPTS